MRAKADIVVLSHTKLGDSTIVLHTLSEAYGRRGFLVKVGPKTAMGLFLPLSILQAEISENPRSELWYARNFTSKAPLASIRSDIHKNTMTLFLSEVLFRVVKDHSKEEGLADWLVKETMTLEALGSDFANFHLHFLLGLCTALGFSPEAVDLAPFCGQHLSQVEFILTRPFSEAMLLPLSGAARNEIAEGILKYIEHHTESAVRIRSLEVLREIYRW